MDSVLKYELFKQNANYCVALFFSYRGQRRGAGRRAAGIRHPLDEADDEPEKVPHPVLLRQAEKETLLFVEGTQCLSLEGDEIDQLHAWGGGQASLCLVKNLATQL